MRRIQYTRWDTSVIWNTTNIIWYKVGYEKNLFRKPLVLRIICTLCLLCRLIGIWKHVHNTQYIYYREKGRCVWWICILLPKLFWTTVRKKCSSHREKVLKFKAEGQEFAKFLRSLEQFIQTVKGQNNFW